MWAVLSSNIAFVGMSKEIESVNKIAWIFHMLTTTSEK